MSFEILECGGRGLSLGRERPSSMMFVFLLQQNCNDKKAQANNKQQQKMMRNKKLRQIAAIRHTPETVTKHGIKTKVQWVPLRGIGKVKISAEKKRRLNLI